MADTARKTKAEKKEHFDSPAVLKQKVKEMAEKLKNSKHAVVFTGAGVSTAAGIADFRSGVNTVLETGPGVWERKATGYNKAPKKSTEVLKAYPTYTHMAIKTLIERGLVKFLISQNVDGLHRRSGVRKDCLAELHGNTNLERCKKCKQEYLRDFRTRKVGNKVHNHETDRKCEVCKTGKLYDSIINFGEDLPDDEFEKGTVNSRKADFCLSLGSSLTVSPACGMPQMVGKKEGADLYICNLQETPVDFWATERLNGKCDEVMRLLMKELEIEVPRWSMERGMDISVDKAGAISVSGINLDSETPYSLFKKVELFKETTTVGPAKKVTTTAETIKSAMPSSSTVKFASKLVNPVQLKSKENLKLRLHFFGHYNEPLLEMPVENGLYKLNLDFAGQPLAWTVERLADIDEEETESTMAEEVSEEDNVNEPSSSSSSHHVPN